MIEGEGQDGERGALEAALPAGSYASAGDHLIEALRSRDPQAIELLYEVCGRRAFGLAYRILGDYSGAEDVVQESFITIWQQAARLDPSRGRLITLLLTIVHNKAIDRRRQKRGQLPLDEDVLRVWQRSTDTAEIVGQEIDRDWVLAALADLPAAQLQTVQLAYFEGLTHVEIAATMHVPLGTVKSRLRIALEHLRSILGEPRP